MEILEIKDIEREPGHIYYRRTYKGTAVISLPTTVANAPVKFTVEMEPMGNKKIELDINQSVEYPLLPLRTALKKFILDMDEKDMLLC